MATTVSLEYLESVLNANGGVVSVAMLGALYNVKGGIPKLDDTTGKLPESLLPAGAFGAYLGDYPSLNELTAAHPTANFAQYASVAGEIYYYNAALATPDWSPASIAISDYNKLSDAAKAGQPEWSIEPDAGD